MRDGARPIAPLDLTLYYVTAAAERTPRGLLKTVEDALAGGVTLVQYRGAHACRRIAFDEALALRRFLARRGIPLLVNDHIDLALAIEADGAHIGQNDLPVAVARKLLGPRRHLGLTINNTAHLEQARAGGELALVDYLGIGPVFPTQTKANPAPTVGLNRLRELVGKSPLPVVAIGGITDATAASVRATGVSGIAVVSAISAAPDVTAAARALRATPPPPVTTG
ncbi:MAG: thiamine phosphate synthase [Puniceicoccales bacterium]|jgi:thiamine-phosphate pyrophosphorylase|nr:thiamine phosphate synthase [Puniceicoccales bacterium]